MNARAATIEIQEREQMCGSLHSRKHKIGGQFRQDRNVFSVLRLRLRVRNDLRDESGDAGLRLECADAGVKFASGCSGCGMKRTK
jgi:hypothetical protein